MFLAGALDDIKGRNGTAVTPLLNISDSSWRESKLAFWLKRNQSVPVTEQYEKK